MHKTEHPSLRMQACSDSLRFAERCVVVLRAARRIALSRGSSWHWCTDATANCFDIIRVPTTATRASRGQYSCIDHRRLQCNYCSAIAQNSQNEALPRKRARNPTILQHVHFTSNGTELNLESIHNSRLTDTNTKVHTTNVTFRQFHKHAITQLASKMSRATMLLATARCHPRAHDTQAQAPSPASTRWMQAAAKQAQHTYVAASGLSGSIRTVLPSMRAASRLGT